MMKSYKENFEKIRELNSSVFSALERALKHLDVDFYLIGAQSRDVWTNHIELKGKRTTTDIDYLVYVKDRDSWNDLIDYLLKNEAFSRDKNLPYRFYKEGTLDLIPFGGIEEDGEVLLDEPAMELSVIGCKEVTENASIAEGDFKIITLPGLCILKLVAYGEKPDHRAKDYSDFLFLLQNFHDIAGEELFHGVYDDLIEGNFELLISAARMLGRQLKPILQTNDELKGKILGVLQAKLSRFSMEAIEQMYAADKNDSKVLEFKLIAETIQGIND